MFARTLSRVVGSSAAFLKMGQPSVYGAAFFSSSAATQKANFVDQINAANAEALDRMNKADLYLTDIAPARELIPFLSGNKKRLLVAGPPVSWKNMAGGQKGAVVAMVLYEGWAKTPEEAYSMLDANQVEIEPNHHHKAAGPMSGVISPSFPIYVVENRAFGNVAYSRAADLAQQFGDYTYLDDIKWWTEGVAPHLRKGLKEMGALPLHNLLQNAQEMGDDSHNRNNSFTSMFVNWLTIGMIKADVPKDKLLPILDWYRSDKWLKGSGVRACLGLVMAAAKASLDPLEGIEKSTVVWCMARNGYEFGIRVAGTGAQWFAAPAPIPKGTFFPPYKQEDAGGDMGDSAITEANGWGSFILSGALGLLPAISNPPSVEQAWKITKDNSSLCLGRSKLYTNPSMNFQGIPIGLDFRRVLSLQCDPWINTGITHKQAKHRVIGRGLVRAPRSCFEQAADAFAAKYNLDKNELIQSVPPPSF